MTDWQPISQVPWMVRMVMWAGFVKSRKQAELFLLGFAAVCIAFTVWSFTSTPHTPQLPQEDPNYDPTLSR